MEITTLKKLYVDYLKDMYSAETQLVKALPKVAANVTNPELREAIENHLEETKGQVERLEQIFGELNESPTGKTCAAMKGLVTEADELIEEVAKGPVLDAGLIGAAQKVEHYEMANYGTARQFARILGYDDQAELLQQTLDEEGAADDTLTEIAESQVNEMAAAVAKAGTPS